MSKHASPVIALLTLSVIAACATTDRIQPFASDGCSDFPDGTRAHRTLWRACCVEHDKAYWRGGTYDDRVAADQALERCVAAVGEPEVARLMLAGVRVGGSPYWPTSFRWGYGWPWPRGYRALTPEERAQADAALPSPAAAR